LNYVETEGLLSYAKTHGIAIIDVL